VFGTVRPPAGRWGSIPRRSTAGSGSWIVTARWPADGGAGRAPPKAGSICWPGRSPWPRSYRGQGQADRRGRPRRTPAVGPSGCRPSSSVTGGISAAAERPGSHVFTPRGAGRCGSQAFGRAVGCRHQGSRPAGPAHPRSSPHCRGVVDRRRRHAQGGRRTAGTPRSAWPLDRYGHQTIPRPVAEGRAIQLGLNLKIRQHGREPHDARSPG
jgi:hypothetical protein